MRAGAARSSARHASRAAAAQFQGKTGTSRGHRPRRRRNLKMTNRGARGNPSTRDAKTKSDTTDIHERSVC